MTKCINLLIRGPTPRSVKTNPGVSGETKSLIPEFGGLIVCLSHRRCCILGAVQQLPAMREIRSTRQALSKVAHALYAAAARSRWLEGHHTCAIWPRGDVPDLGDGQLENRRRSPRGPCGRSAGIHSANPCFKFLFA